MGRHIGGQFQLPITEQQTTLKLTGLKPFYLLTVPQSGLGSAGKSFYSLASGHAGGYIQLVGQMGAGLSWEGWASVSPFNLRALLASCDLYVVSPPGQLDFFTVIQDFQEDKRETSTSP